MFPRQAALNQLTLQEASASRASFDTEKGTLSIAFTSPSSFKVCFGADKTDHYQLLQPTDTVPDLHCHTTASGYCIEAGEVRIELSANPIRLSVWQGQHLKLQTTLDAHMGGGTRVPALYQEDGWTGWSFALASGEGVYGLGEKFGRLNKRGEYICNWNEDALGVNSELSYKNVPFAWSLKGWGIVLNTSAKVVHGVGYGQWSYRSYCVASQEDSQELHVLLADSPAQMLDVYTTLTGKAPSVPRWSLGLWMSRAYYRTAEEAMSIARDIRERNIPCDVFTLDGRAWLKVETRCTLDFDPERYPDPKAWIAELKKLNYKLCVWEYPYISTQNEIYPELAQKNYFLKTASGEPYVYQWDPAPFNSVLTPLPESGMIDFTHPEAYQWYQHNHQKLWDLGVDVMKTDFAEQIPEDVHAHNGDTGKELHNVYALLYNQAVYDVTPERIVWGRSAWIGSQKYPVQWGGDPQTDWEGLAGSIRGGLCWGLSGVPYHSHDIGGFYGPPPSPLLLLRWTQAAMLFSHARFHGTSPREPWYFGETVEELCKRWIRLRYRLLPYLTQCCTIATQTGLPVQRAMVLSFPEDVAAHAFEHQWMLGDALLIAPVLQEDHRVVVYLPSGNDWVNIFTGEHHAGGQVLHIHAPETWLPVFGRVGYSVDIGEVAECTALIPETPSYTLHFSPHTPAQMQLLD